MTFVSLKNPKLIFILLFELLLIQGTKDFKNFTSTQISLKNDQRKDLLLQRTKRKTENYLKNASLMKMLLVKSNVLRLYLIAIEIEENVSVCASISFVQSATWSHFNEFRKKSIVSCYNCFFRFSHNMFSCNRSCKFAKNGSRASKAS